MPDEIIPRDRAELLWDAIINHTIEAVDAIRDRPELIAAAIAAGLPDMLGDPRDRYEMFLKAIAGAQGSTGTVVDDSVTGWDILYQATSLTFSGSASTFVDTGIKPLSSTYSSRDLKIILKNVSSGYNPGFTNTMLYCKTGGNGIRFGLSGSLPSPHNNDIFMTTNSGCDEIVIRRIGGVWSGQVFNEKNATNCSSLLPRWTGTYENDSNLYLGGGLNESFEPTGYCNGSLGEIIVALK